MKESLLIPDKFNVHLQAVEAITIGSAAAKLINKEGMIGKICGVFNRTANILSGDNELLTLARNDVCNGPVTILLDIPASINIPALGFEMEAEVVKSGEVIHIRGSNVIINLGQATLWKAGRQLKMSLPIKDIMRNCDVAKDIGRKYGKRGGISGLLVHYDALVKGETIDEQGLNLYSRHALPRITTLIKAVQTRNPGDVNISVKGLIGLGPGLTPSGDDMLMGFMSSLLLVTEVLDGDIACIRELNQVIISTVDGRTSLLSRKSLEYAALGEIPELTHNLIAAIAAGTEEQVEKAAFPLLTVGHCSGTDMLLGILLGFHVALNMS